VREAELDRAAPLGQRPVRGGHVLAGPLRVGRASRRVQVGGTVLCRPRSVQATKIARASSRSAPQPQSGPKVMVPSGIGDTRRPDRPSSR
jgi:hypothetical protein